MRVCGLVNKGGIAFRCNIQITKTPELRFHAVLGDGDREVRLEWGDRASASWKERYRKPIRMQIAPPRVIVNLTPLRGYDSPPRWARSRRWRWSWSNGYALVLCSGNCMQGVFSEIRSTLGLVTYFVTL